VNSPLPVAVLISGGGTTLCNLIGRVASGGLDIDIRLVVSNNPAARGLEFATDASIATAVVDHHEYSSDEQFSEAIFTRCRAAGARLVVMGGFLRFLPIPDDFENRVVNIHPGLIPSFCGKGFYGLNVHRAVLEYGAKISGCTVHFVDNQYDHGPIILQRVVDVSDSDTPETLAARVFDAECEALPGALQLIAKGQIKVDGRIVRDC